MSNEWIERIVHSEIIDRKIFIITSPSILIELVDPCKLLGGLINSVKKFAIGLFGPKQVLMQGAGA